MLAFGVSGVFSFAIAAGAFAPWRSRTAEAQIDLAEPAAELPPAHDDPELTGKEPPLTAADAALAVPATPVVTPDPEIPELVWEPTDAGMSTSLGGSDVAVASEGQSHQVDGPKRKVNKVLGEKKRP